MKSVYSDYVSKAFRFYTRYPNPTFKSEADKNNWNACKTALENFSTSEKELIIPVYLEGDTIADNVYQVSKRNHIPQLRLWELIWKLEEDFAKIRGLI